MKRTKRSNSGPLHRLPHVGPAHVIDHHSRGQRRKEGLELRQVRCLEVHHHVPAERRDASRDLLQNFGGRDVDQALHEVEAHAANAGVMQLRELAYR